MVIVGLTGSVGMGKSETARMFARERVPVFDADAAVHEVMAPGGAALAAVSAAFPGVVQHGVIDRAELGRRVFRDAAARQRLEGIIHPLVRGRQGAFLRRAAARRAALVVLDIPLLFETGGERRCDLTVTVSAPPFVQRERVLGRPGMSAERLDQVRASQLPDAAKRRRADVVVRSGLGRGPALRQVRRIVRMAQSLGGRHWPPR